MINFGNLWALARAEMRLTRRLVRYWIFTVLACLLMGVFYVYYALLHANFSFYSATVAWINPRFFAGGMGFWFAQVMMLGITFLAFEVRARDQRERVAEVLDSRPFTNLELLAGRALGIIIPVWIPTLVMAGVLVLVGWLADGPVSPVALFYLVFVVTLPTFVLALPLAFVVSLVVRARLAAAIVMVTIIFGAFILAIFVVPGWAGPSIELTGSAGQPFHSDVASFVATIDMWLHQAGIVLGGLGLLLIAAALHPRRDEGSPVLRYGVGALLVAAMIACLAWGALYRGGGIEQRKAWRAAHRALADRTAPDLLAMKAHATLEPGHRLRIETELEAAAPGSESLESLLFTLNPGLEVATVTSGGADLVFTHESGILEIIPSGPLGPGETFAATIVAEGRPDLRFGNTDADSDIGDESLNNYNGVILLGTENAIFHARHAALLPGAAWLPRSGVDIGRDDPTRRNPERFEFTLTLDVPEGFLAAGPGRRESIEGAASGFVRYRFAPGAPVPDPGLVVGRFVSRQMEVAGTLFEILVDPAHTANLELFARAGDELRAQLEERLEQANEWGLDYPYGAFTLVEVPNRLRGYEAGWRQDTALAPPAMLLLRESSFPTARFKQRFEDEERWEDAEGGVEGEMIRHLARFFENDFGGGNIFTAFSRNLIRYPRPASGESSIALNFVLDDLASEIVTDRRGYFSTYLFDSGLNAMVGQAITGLFVSGFRRSLAEIVTEQATDRPDVWDSILGASLADIDPTEDAERAQDVLTLKGGAFNRYLVETQGKDSIGRWLGAIRATEVAESITRSDVVAAGEAAGLDLATTMKTWLDETDLPAFELGPADYERLADDDAGNPRYQVSVPVLNSGRAEGLVQLKWVRFADDTREEGEGEVVSIPSGESREIGLVVDREPTRTWVSTFFSLNRGAMALSLQPIDENAPMSDAEPLNGARPSDWAPRDDGSILVDDLDEGFEAETAPPSGLLAFFRQGDGERNDEAELDNGLPVQEFQPPGQGWMRYRNFSAYGRYRRTAAMAAAGKGSSIVRFRAELPGEGRYRLELYMPSMRAFGQPIERSPLGTWTIRVEDSVGSEEVPFEASSSTEGWNEVNEFDLARGAVTLTLTNKLEDGGRLVVADAIRWVPVERRKGETE